MIGTTQILEEIEKERAALGVRGVPDVAIAGLVLCKKLRLFADLRKRNTLLYYSNWPANDSIKTSLNQVDRDNLMIKINDLPTEKGLDFIINTPGGDINVAASLIKRFRKDFNDDIEVFIPHKAMSAGTTIACASRCIHMLRDATIGPADPQLYGHSIVGRLADFERARTEIQEDQSCALLWKIHFESQLAIPIEECKAVLNWCRKILRTSLTEVMFADGKGRENTEEIIKQLTTLEHTITHSRAIDIDEAQQKLKLKVKLISEPTELEKLLSSIYDFSRFITNAANHYKLYGNSSLPYVTLGGKKG